MGPPSTWASREWGGAGWDTAFKEWLWVGSGQGKEVPIPANGCEWYKAWPGLILTSRWTLFAAPEVVGRQRYGRPVDCWAIGVIMYIL